MWYADNNIQKIQALRKKVLDLVKKRPTTASQQAASSRKKGQRGQQDQERKVKIEKSAISVCRNYYEALGYEVKSVERDNLGWDLEAKHGKIALRIEVKGLSGTSLSVELTPNEYNAFQKKDPDYRLAAILQALEKHPQLRICRYSGKKSQWIAEGHGSLIITPKRSAIISL
ncbi:MAG: protein NO VEIN domain-containing protein [Gammaproteobacteria bacterium]